MYEASKGEKTPQQNETSESSASFSQIASQLHFLNSLSKKALKSPENKETCEFNLEEVIDGSTKCVHSPQVQETKIPLLVLAKLKCVLTCPICHKLLKEEPVVNNTCGHAFCFECINPVIEDGFVPSVDNWPYSDFLVDAIAEETEWLQKHKKVKTEAHENENVKAKIKKEVKSDSDEEAPVVSVSGSKQDTHEDEDSVVSISPPPHAQASVSQSKKRSRGAETKNSPSIKESSSKKKKASPNKKLTKMQFSCPVCLGSAFKFTLVSLPFMAELITSLTASIPTLEEQLNGLTRETFEADKETGETKRESIVGKDPSYVVVSSSTDMSRPNSGYLNQIPSQNQNDVHGGSTNEDKITGRKEEELSENIPSTSDDNSKHRSTLQSTLELFAAPPNKAMNTSEMDFAAHAPNILSHKHNNHIHAALTTPNTDGNVKPVAKGNDDVVLGGQRSSALHESINVPLGQGGDPVQRSINFDLDISQQTSTRGGEHVNLLRSNAEANKRFSTRNSGHREGEKREELVLGVVSDRSMSGPPPANEDSEKTETPLKNNGKHENTSEQKEEIGSDTISFTQIGGERSSALLGSNPSMPFFLTDDKSFLEKESVRKFSQKFRIFALNEFKGTISGRKWKEPCSPFPFLSAAFQIEEKERFPSWRQIEKKLLSQGVGILFPREKGAVATPITCNGDTTPLMALAIRCGILTFEIGGLSRYFESDNNFHELLRKDAVNVVAAEPANNGDEHRNEGLLWFQQLHHQYVSLGRPGRLKKLHTLDSHNISQVGRVAVNKELNSNGIGEHTAVVFLPDLWLEIIFEKLCLQDQGSKRSGSVASSSDVRKTTVSSVKVSGCTLQSWGYLLEVLGLPSISVSTSFFTEKMLNILISTLARIGEESGLKTDKGETLSLLLSLLEKQCGSGLGDEEWIRWQSAERSPKTVFAFRHLVLLFSAQKKNSLLQLYCCKESQHRAKLDQKIDQILVWIVQILAEVCSYLTSNSSEIMKKSLSCSSVNSEVHSTHWLLNHFYAFVESELNGNNSSAESIDHKEHKTGLPTTEGSCTRGASQRVRVGVNSDLLMTSYTQENSQSRPLQLDMNGRYLIYTDTP